jgi:hypothetical protein
MLKWRAAAAKRAAVAAPRATKRASLSLVLATPPPASTPAAGAFGPGLGWQASHAREPSADPSLLLITDAPHMTGAKRPPLPSARPVRTSTTSPQDSASAALRVLRGVLEHHPGVGPLPSMKLVPVGLTRLARPRSQLAFLAAARFLASTFRAFARAARRFSRTAGSVMRLLGVAVFG